MSHEFVTLAIPFQNCLVDEVNRKLDELQNPAAKRVRDALRGQGIHFMSLTVVPPDKRHAAYLVLEATLDGNGSSAIDRIARSFGPILLEVLKVSGHSSDATRLASLLARYQHQPKVGLFGTVGLNFTGTPGMSVERIRREFELSRKCRDLLDLPPFDLTALGRLKQVRQVIANDREFSELLTPGDTLLLQPGGGGVSVIPLVARGVFVFAWPLLILIAGLAVGGWFAADRVIGSGWGFPAAFLVLLMGAFGLAGLAGFIYARLRGMEKGASPDDSLPNPERLCEVQNRENRSEQNHLAGISVMKPGWIRYLALRIVYWVITQMATRVFPPGYLGELNTIHFARWVLLPGTNKLLFFSNYGGSWESYLEDFITKAHGGLTGVWSNTYGFPRTRNLFLDGATDGDRFKRWARRQQYPTRFWYSAYPFLTTARIRHNAAIRHYLAVASTEDEAAEWLNHFGSIPPQPDTIENNQIQSILFGGFKPLKHATCLVVRLPSDPERARRWLAEIAPEISFGGGPLLESVTQVAFTVTGLERLGLSADALGTFPVAFTQGMSSPSRASILADTGDDKADTWLWGNEKNHVDAAIALYHRTADGLDQLVKSNCRRLEQHRGEVAYEVRMRALRDGVPTREPFGFVDGISQPQIRGVTRGVPARDELHSVEPGEFILGYHDNRGHFPHTPTIPATSDPHNLLTTTAIVTDNHITSPAVSRANYDRDLGRNGSFLVIRHLEQDVDAFNSVLSEAAEKLAATNHPGIPAGLNQTQIAEWVAAKIIGRWRDGTSLIQFPNRPGTGWCGTRNQPLDNSFQFGDEDKLGYRVPLGAHIRRANPRSSLGPDSPEQISITNRHRILRIGRPYGPQEADRKRGDSVGLLFMCLNADIERQFEFIQQTWLMSRHFHGLDGEVDSIVGRGQKGGRLTIPTPSGPLPVAGIKDFVTVRGGGYFFLPALRTVRYLSQELPR